MISLSIITATVFGVVAAAASPTQAASDRGCSLAGYRAPVATGMTVPTTVPSFLGLGVGFQNYTCNATSNAYVSAGAVADLFDVSCNYRTIGFSNITNATFDLWSESSIPWQTTNAPLLGHHYFVHPTPGAAIAPEWDFTTTGATKGNANAYVIGAKDVSVAGAHPTVDVPSLQLHNVSGKLATSIYRLATVNGQPPANCSGSESLFVKYTALYVLYGYNA